MGIIPDLSMTASYLAALVYGVVLDKDLDWVWQELMDIRLPPCIKVFRFDNKIIQLFSSNFNRYFVRFL